MKTFVACAFALVSMSTLPAAEPVFSGPQVGEKTTPFPVLELWGPNTGIKRDPITENGGRPSAIVFVNGLERSLVPLLRAIDQYGAARADRLRVETVFLFADRVQGEQRVRAAANSLKLHSRVSLSLDGAEGPGNYGLNKECMMTILAAKENTVTANFALVQPGIADAPKVIAALARTCGDDTPPSIEQLTQRPGPPSGLRVIEMERPRNPTSDLSRHDLNSEAGLREAVRGLLAEVQKLRSEVDELRGAGKQPEPSPQPEPERFPGAVPEDAKLNSLLRQVIRADNADEAADKLMAEMEVYVNGNDDLTKQAVNGWVRVLHFGDRYGTAHTRALGRAFLEKHGGKP